MGARRLVILLFILLNLTLASNSTAQSVPATSPSIPLTPPPSDKTIQHALPERVPAMRTVVASRLRGSIVLDGRLDEPAWKQGFFGGDFFEHTPSNGRPSRFRTEFRVVYDDKALYVGVIAYDPSPGQIAAPLGRKDSLLSSDWIKVAIDSYNDKRTAFRFAVNPAGVQLDDLLYNDSLSDVSWDAVWESFTAYHKEGWSAEFRIPFGQLRFSDRVAQTWGIQIFRHIQRENQIDTWSVWPKATQKTVSHFGTLSGLIDLPAMRRFELVPFVAAGLRHTSVTGGDPLNDGTDAIGNAGLDAKVGLSSSFTLSATINPDFGQVEADPSEVNLTDKETFFAEKRPFFLEGVDLFRVNLDSNDEPETLFYSRRIGAPPRGSAGDAAFAKIPQATTIYGAAKVSGKTSFGTSLGLLTAVTAQESAEALDVDGNSDDIVVEPLANYSIARAKQDFRGGKTVLSGTASAVHRRLDDTQLVGVHRAAYTGGVDFSHQFARNTWQVDTGWYFSSVHGSKEAIANTQLSSVHYFQRPGAGHLSFDPNLTSLQGYAGYYKIARENAEHLRFGTGGTVRSPGFEPNDLGYISSVDSFDPWVWAQLHDDRPGQFLTAANINFNLWSGTTLGGEWKNTSGNINGGADFRNGWGFSGGVELGYNRRDPGGLRGGPALRRDTVYSYWFDAWTDERAKLQVNLHSNGYLAPASDSLGGEVDLEVIARPMSFLQLSLNTGLFAQHDDNQYVGESADATGTPHYVMARMKQVLWRTVLRADYTVTPKLSFQLYAQPFITTGRFDEYKEVVAPDAEKYPDRYSTFAMNQLLAMDNQFGADRNSDGVAEYAFRRADFNVRQLRSNLVMRWEYSPGSTFFLIWSQARSSFGDTGKFVFDEEASHWFSGTTAEHVVMAKLSYWFGL